MLINHFFLTFLIIPLFPITSNNTSWPYYFIYSALHPYSIKICLSCSVPSFLMSTSGMQRLLDARGQRGSWMPSKIFFIRLFIPQNFWRPFLVVHLNFSNSSPKIVLTTFFTFSHQLSNFTKIRSLDAPLVLHHALVTTFFSSFLSFTYIFFTRTGCPQGGCPGPSHRLHPPLHATDVYLFSAVLHLSSMSKAP